ncbi:hypothetical protein [Sulfolobus acidocaldarius]|uniref:Uncharacterized protein n=4 Tax=Sulfolobus acidocaldarius TaxID=2285 RepID=Q4J7K4_SULAC|nr:hypothetical protein [Sulfolobus acidocaldarius]AAY81227.1 hypothetical protein Saci_1924 [Sulfolobus acidocaldarius DSM 639]AGE71850.1 hypothetical protein SacN8_09455 [Sulfolobus acidocaldarius N8]AGE74122.1 hypothetical protein SacRon12I_09475 [Sulfolobus acidocaldarius Ron12/I]ALU29965.1 hypothetical protein ATY89_08475 [Sulfolobus acidocaldarius]ALU32707.1 hypothetical protein ATZ20_11480 [Sulfolobus acidocaldarius]
MIKVDPGVLNPYAELKLIDEGVEIEANSIEHVVIRFLSSEDAILKIDCEGCERYMTSFPESLNKFMGYPVSYFNLIKLILFKSIGNNQFVSNGFGSNPLSFNQW